MAGAVLHVGKKGSTSTPVVLIKGDSNTHIVHLCVNRFYGGVDLAPLAWSVVVENSDSESDRYNAENMLIGENIISMDWRIKGTATAKVGKTKFKVEGLANDNGPTVWQSGEYYILIDDTFDYVPGSETEAALTAVQELIIYVDGELKNVLQAGSDAAEAATAANMAADMAGKAANAATAAADAANNAAEAANEAADRANNITGGGGKIDLDTTLSIPGQAADAAAVGAALADKVSTEQHAEDLASINKRIDDLEESGGSGATPEQLVQIEQNRLDIAEINEVLTVDTEGYNLTGNPVELELLGGLPMNVVSPDIAFVQAGTGDPTPDNIRPITGYDSAKLTHNGTEYTVEFGQTVYMGSYDWNTGLLTITHKKCTLDNTTGENNWSFLVGSLTNYISIYYNWLLNPNGTAWSNSHVHAPLGVLPSDHGRFRMYSNGFTIYANKTITTKEQMIQHLRDVGFYAICELATPITVQLTPRDILSVDGVNTLSCDIGDITVSGRRDIWYKIDYLSEKIDKLNSAILTLGGNV